MLAAIKFLSILLIIQQAVHMVSTMKYFVSAAFLLLLSACGPSLEDARKSGFDSVEEMKKLQAEGFKTKGEWIAKVKADEEAARKIQEENEAARKRQEAEEKEAKLLAEKAAHEEYLEHSTDAKWLDEKYGLEGPIRCSSGADNYLREIAKFSFKWDETGWLETKFDTYSTLVKAPGVITYSTKKVSLQNGFGAYQRIKLACDYDTQSKTVVEYWTQ